MDILHFNEALGHKLACAYDKQYTTDQSTVCYQCGVSIVLELFCSNGRKISQERGETVLYPTKTMNY